MKKIGEVYGIRIDPVRLLERLQREDYSLVNKSLPDVTIISQDNKPVGMIMYRDSRTIRISAWDDGLVDVLRSESSRAK